MNFFPRKSNDSCNESVGSFSSFCVPQQRRGKNSSRSTSSSSSTRRKEEKKAKRQESVGKDSCCATKNKSGSSNSSTTSSSHSKLRFLPRHWNVPLHRTENGTCDSKAKKAKVALPSALKAHNLAYNKVHDDDSSSCCTKQQRPVKDHYTLEPTLTTLLSSSSLSSSSSSSSVSYSAAGKQLEGGSLLADNNSMMDEYSCVSWDDTPNAEMTSVTSTRSSTSLRPITSNGSTQDTRVSTKPMTTTPSSKTMGSLLRGFDTLELQPCNRNDKSFQVPSPTNVTPTKELPVSAGKEPSMEQQRNTALMQVDAAKQALNLKEKAMIMLAKELKSRTDQNKQKDKMIHKLMLVVTEMVNDLKQVDIQLKRGNSDQKDQYIKQLSMVVSDMDRELTERKQACQEMELKMVQMQKECADKRQEYESNAQQLRQQLLDSRMEVERLRAQVARNNGTASPDDMGSHENNNTLNFSNVYSPALANATSSPMPTKHELQRRSRSSVFDSTSDFSVLSMSIDKEIDQVIAVNKRIRLQQRKRRMTAMACCAVLIVFRFLLLPAMNYVSTSFATTSSPVRNVVCDDKTSIWENAPWWDPLNVKHHACRWLCNEN